MRPLIQYTAALVAAMSLVATARAGESLVLLPAEISLTGHEARQSLVAERVQGGKFVGQQVEGLVLESSAPAIVRIEGNVLRPVANGDAVVTAKAAGKTAVAKVRVRGLEKPFVWSFRNHVESVLAKAGCSMGACHGAQAGKNGFKLSLLGYDPAGDYLAITRQARGRRVVGSDPGRSLLLTKPTGAIPHKGGVRLAAGSPEYRVLADWIAAGMPAPAKEDPRLVRLEVWPPAVVLKPGTRQQMVLLAHFTDGHVEDVTRWGRYTSTNESVGKIDERGLVSIAGHGEGAITAWYLSKVVTATVTSPYTAAIADEVFAKAPRRNFIDDLVLEKLAALRIPPSQRAGDEEFVRRVFLDTIGVLPTADETRAFLADKSPGKRDALIERLLMRPEWVDYWSYKWSDLLLVNSEKLKFSGGDKDKAAMWAYYNWIRNRVEADAPWDQVAREVVTASGNTLENGAANFYVLHKDPLDLAETTTVAFLGMSINCARCHNHPLEKWTNDQYYAMSNLYARVRTKLGPSGGQEVFVTPEGDLIQPLSGKPQPPTPLDGEALAIAAPADRRLHLAKWLTSPDNPYFSRAITNRVWANFFGAGLVELVDDMRLTNPASNEKLLGAAAGYLVEHHYDIKALVRTILQSETYQRTSRPLAENVQDKRFYSHYYPKRLMAEVMLDAISQVTTVPTQFPGFPEGWRAMQLPDSVIDSHFLQTFGRPERVATCTCERTAEPSMVQVLHISNGKSLNGKLEAKNNLIGRWMTKKLTPDALVDDLYLSALSRHPTEKEKAAILPVLASAEGADRRAVLEDLCWGVLSSKEFLLNH